LQTNAKIRIRDNATTYNAKVKEDTAGFKIIGEVTISQPTSIAQWRVGETSREVTWTAKGDMCTLTVNYNYGSGYEWLVDVAATAEKWTWEDPSPSISGIADHISDTVRVKIEDKDKPSDTSVQSQTFKIIGSLDLQWPVGGENVVKGSNQNIQWVKWGSIGTLLIEFYNGTGWETLETNYSAGTDGQLTSRAWTVPDKITNNAKVKITSNTYPTYTETSNPFTIKGNFSSINPPDSTTVWKVGDTNTITWVATGTMSTVDIEFSSNGGGGWSFISENKGSLVEGTNNHNWYIDPLDIDFDVKSNNCLVKITSDQNPDVNITSQTFTVIPKITPTPSTWIAETTPTITWSYTGTKTTLVNVILDRNWTGTWENETTLATNLPIQTQSQPYTIPTNIGSTRSGTTRVRFVDTTNSYSYGESASFAIIGEIT
ncbi:MAG: hypothetical protein AAB267_00440, partial [Candidatus Desantisbacteria bacterium]